MCDLFHAAFYFPARCDTTTVCTVQWFWSGDHLGTGLWATTPHPHTHNSAKTLLLCFSFLSSCHVYCQRCSSLCNRDYLSCLTNQTIVNIVCPVCASLACLIQTSNGIVPTVYFFGFVLASPSDRFDLTVVTVYIPIFALILFNLSISTIITTVSFLGVVPVSATRLVYTDIKSFLSGIATIPTSQPDTQSKISKWPPMTWMIGENAVLQFSLSLQACLKLVMATLSCLWQVNT